MLISNSFKLKTTEAPFTTHMNEGSKRAVNAAFDTGKKKLLIFSVVLKNYKHGIFLCQF